MVSSHTQHASFQKLHQGFVGTLQSLHTFLQKNISEQRQPWYHGFREAFEMAGLDVAGSHICQEVLALPQFPNLLLKLFTSFILFFWQISLSKNPRNSKTAFQFGHKISHTFKREFVSLYVCHYGMINLKHNGFLVKTMCNTPVCFQSFLCFNDLSALLLSLQKQKLGMEKVFLSYCKLYHLRIVI